MINYQKVRSASFDEIQLEAQRAAQLFKYHQTASTDEQTTSGLLQVPQVTGQRSRSFDSAGSDDSGTFLEVPRRFQRRKSNSKTPPPCIHCQYVEEYNRMLSVQLQDELHLQLQQQHIHQQSPLSGSQSAHSNIFNKYETEMVMRRSFSSFTDYSSSASTSSTVSSDSSAGEEDGDDGDGDCDGGRAGGGRGSGGGGGGGGGIHGGRARSDVGIRMGCGNVRLGTGCNIIDDEEDEKQHKQREDDIEYIINSRKSLLQPPVSPMASPCEITFMLVDLPELATGAAAIGTSTSPLLPTILSPVYPNSPMTSRIGELPPGGFDDTPPPQRARRRSISRQEAIIEPTGNSLENVNIQFKDNNNSSSCCSNNSTGAGADITGAVGGGSIDGVDYKNITLTCNKTFDSNINNNNNNNSNISNCNNANSNNETYIVGNIFLTVPELKRDRAASVDSCFSKVSSAAKTEELQPPVGDLTLLVVPNSGATRSRSVDIVLPTEEQARYKALALTGPNNSGNNNGGGGAGAGATTGDGINILYSNRYVQFIQLNSFYFKSNIYVYMNFICGISLQFGIEFIIFYAKISYFQIKSNRIEGEEGINKL